MSQNTKQQIKGFDSVFHGKHIWGHAEELPLICLFALDCPNQGLFQAAPFAPPAKLFRLPCVSLLFPFICLICEKNQRGSPASHRLGELVSLQGCRCWSEKTQKGSGEARQVLSIIQHVKREEGERKRGRVKAGSRVGVKSLG